MTLFTVENGNTVYDNRLDLVFNGFDTINLYSNNMTLPFVRNFESIGLRDEEHEITLTDLSFIFTNDEIALIQFGDLDFQIIED